MKATKAYYIVICTSNVLCLYNSVVLLFFIKGYLFFSLGRKPLQVRSRKTWYNTNLEIGNVIHKCAG